MTEFCSKCCLSLLSFIHVDIEGQESEQGKGVKEGVEEDVVRDCQEGGQRGGDAIEMLGWDGLFEEGR